MPIETCQCEELHRPRRVAITGGPCAGKTALLEAVRRHYCRHVLVLPESASLLFRGGFPRRSDALGRMATQRAIYRVQDELETLALGDASAALIVCDRGTIDGAAYWPGPPDAFFTAVGSSYAKELARYDAVIHLRTPRLGRGYFSNGSLRTETASEAVELDKRIEVAWSGHPRRRFVEDEDDFMDKLRQAMVLIRAELPECCRAGAVSGVSLVR